MNTENTDQKMQKPTTETRRKARASIGASENRGIGRAKEPRRLHLLPKWDFKVGLKSAPSVGRFKHLESVRKHFVPGFSMGLKMG
jgi:hypothetical protein